MALRVVGAGLGRTGTNSLKLALEQLLGGRCYHMLEAFDRPDDTGVWHAAARDEPVDWTAFMADFTASVDWPACSFWRELADANRDAVVLLSTRESAERWWESVSQTIWLSVSEPIPPDEPERLARRAMIIDLLERRFDPNWRDGDAAMRAYERHNSEVRTSVSAERLVDWRTGDGWGPICAALELPVPDEPFPHANTQAEFRAEQGLDPSS